MDQESDGQTGRTRETVREAATRRVKPYAVLNGYGEQLATFAEWEEAHAWAHLAASEGSAVLPVEVEERLQRITRRITRETCELIAWTIFTKIAGCEPREEQLRIPPYALG
ncbi:hypothetical protein [Frankia sp. Cppng1_Ct_nod]|uniref:hypothetical protein n=1 Tax=Frankia sp. Cppng1_Ct_nod TaxID=2897162 RepID=UPI0010413A8A|nr:hypothetical protein [Frankia sp. Cppng1_Ct_nod]